MAPPARTSGRSRVWAHKKRVPSAVRSHQPVVGGAVLSSRTRSSVQTPAASTKVTESSSATPGPPQAAYRPAPASGATSFMPSVAVMRSPLKSPSRDRSTAVATRADSAASSTTPTAP